MWMAFVLPVPLRLTLLLLPLRLPLRLFRLPLALLLLLPLSLLVWRVIAGSSAIVWLRSLECRVAGTYPRKLSTRHCVLDPCDDTGEYRRFRPSRDGDTRECSVTGNGAVLATRCSRRGARGAVLAARCSRRGARGVPCPARRGIACPDAAAASPARRAPR